MTRFQQITCCGALLLCWAVAGTSVAAGPNVWDGPYVGPQLGDATNRGCSSYILRGPGLDAGGQTTSQACSSGSVVGGAEIGENFQYKHVFWGLAADIDVATGTKSNRSWVSNGTSSPKGTYLASERLSPDGFLMIAPRLGYAGREWAPYLRAGGLAAFGGRDSSVTYTPSGGTRSTASFTGGKSFDTFGWVAGGGIEWGLYGPWSIGFEYMHANLGKGSSASAGCAGTVVACQGFSGIAFENLHTPFTVNLYRIAVNYYFDFW